MQDRATCRMWFIVRLVNGWKPLTIVTKSFISNVVGASYTLILSDIYERKRLIKAEWKREENFHACVQGEKKGFPKTRLGFNAGVVTWKQPVRFSFIGFGPVLPLYRNQAIIRQFQLMGWFLHNGNTGLKWVKKRSF